MPGTDPNQPENSNAPIEYYLDQLNRLYDGKPWLGKSFKEILKNITPEQAFVKLHDQQHTIAELLSHVIGWREIVINRIMKSDAPRLKQAETFDPYRFGNTKEEIWGKMLRTFEETQSFLIQYLRNTLEAHHPIRRFPHQRINGIIQHDIYHMGHLSGIKRATRSEL